MMVLNQQLLANFGLTAVPALGVLSVSSVQAEAEPRVYSGMTYATLGGDQIGFGTWRSSSPRTCQYSLLQEAVTREWRFCVADSVPVPLSGSDQKHT
jgi:hypothetical protein